jgi:unspecific peroxygenase
VNAVQEGGSAFYSVDDMLIVGGLWAGFNMENRLAIFITWGAFLVDGNLITNFMSIGRKTEETGPNPPPPAVVGGLNTHGLFEGE